MIDILKLHALADNQLDPVEAAQIQNAIQNDPNLLAEYRAIVTVKQCLESKVSSVSCDETWRRCVGRLNEIDQSRHVEGFVGRFAWALCGVFFFLIVFSGIKNRDVVSGSGMETADLAHMMTNFGASGPAPISAMDRRIDSQLQRARKALSEKKMNVVDRRAQQIDGLMVSRYLLNDKVGRMMFIAIPEIVMFEDMTAMPQNPQMGCGKVGALNCIGWHQQGYTFALFGDRSHLDLAIVASELVR